MYSYEKPGYRDLESRDKIASPSQHSGQNGIILVLYVFPLKSIRISFISKVIRVHKAMAVSNNASLCSSISVVFLEFIPVDRVEISHMNIPQNLSRLPGLHEEALGWWVLVLELYRVLPFCTPFCQEQ